MGAYKAAWQGETPVTNETYGGPGADRSYDGPQWVDDSERGRWKNKRGTVQMVNGELVQVGKSGAEEDVDRFRGMAEESAGRDAYQLQFGKALTNEKQGKQVRSMQNDAATMQRDAAMGKAPSRAAIEGGQVGANALEAGMMGAAGARGGQPNLGFARAQGAAQLQGVGRATGGRSTELGGARMAYGQGVNALRTGDYAAQQLAQDRVGAQAQSELMQRRLNDRREIANEQRGFDVRKMDQNSMLSMEEIDAQNAGAQAAAKAGEKRSDQATAAKGAATVFSVATKIPSDKRVKEKAALPGLGVQGKSFKREDDEPKFGLTRGRDDGSPTWGNDVETDAEPVPDSREEESTSHARTWGGPDEGAPDTESLHAGIERSIEDEPAAKKELAYGSGPQAAPKGYSKSRAGEAGDMFHGGEEAHRGDRTNLSLSEDEHLAPGTGDFLKYGSSSKKPDDYSKAVSLSDAGAKREAYLRGKRHGELTMQQEPPTRKKSDNDATRKQVEQDTRDWQMVHGTGENPDLKEPEKMPIPPAPNFAAGAEATFGTPKPKTPALAKPVNFDAGVEETFGPAKTSDKGAKNVGGGDEELQKDANRKLQGSTYTYKEGVGEDTEQVHHGQMAQTMEENPITATAVREDETGIKKVSEFDKLNVTAAGVASLQKQQDEMADALEKMMSRRSRRT